MLRCSPFFRNVITIKWRIKDFGFRYDDMNLFFSSYITMSLGKTVIRGTQRRAMNSGRDS